jgi:hypothetical protein
MAVVFAFLGEDFDPAIITDQERRVATLGSRNSPLTEAVLQPIRMAETPASNHLLSWQQRARVVAAVAPLMPTLGYPQPPRRLVVAGRAANMVFWPRIAARLLRRKALDRWGSPARRRAEMWQRRDEQVQRRMQKQAARRSAADDRATR